MKVSTSLYNEYMKTKEEEKYKDYRLPPDFQKKRIRAVIDNELTDIQREILFDILSGKTQKEIAEERGVCCSTVCRTFHRAMDRIRKFTRF